MTRCLIKGDEKEAVTGEFDRDAEAAAPTIVVILRPVTKDTSLLFWLERMYNAAPGRQWSQIELKSNQLLMGSSGRYRWNVIISMLVI